MSVHNNIAVVIPFACFFYSPASFSAPPEPEPAPPDAGAENASPEPTAEPELTKLPTLIAFVEADYPQNALETGLEAEVVLEIDIDALGRVEGVSVLQPSAHPEVGFEEAAMAAARGFGFEPAEAAGEPVPVRITFRYRFVLPAPEPSPAPDAQATADPPNAEAKDPVLNFRGRILERGTRADLPGALVTIFRDDGDEPQGFEAVADDIGRFEFYDLAPGAWKILVEPNGYYPLRTQEQIRPGELFEATYYIEKASYNPFDVLVEARRLRKEVNRTSLTVAEADKVPGTFGDVIQVVQNLPSVARAATGTGDVIVRGSAPEDTAVYVEGVNIPILYHFGGLRSVVPVGMLDRIDFYPGNFSAVYGDATGGIVDVGLKDLKADGFGGYVDVSILDTGLYLELPIGETFAIAVAGRRSYIDAFLNAVVPADAPVSLVSAPRYYDYQLLATWRPAPAHQLRAFFFGSDDELAILFDNPADNNVQSQAEDASAFTRFYRTLLEYRFAPTENLKNTLKVSAGRNWIGFNSGEELNFNLNFYLAQMRDVLRWRYAGWGELKVGGDFKYYQTDISLRLPPVSKEGEPANNLDLDLVQQSELRDQVSVTGAVFAETEIEILPDLLVIPGLRLDYYSQLGEPFFGPRLATRFGIYPVLALKGGIGVYAQTPQPDEVAPDFGNPDLKPEWAIHTSVGFEIKPFDFLTIDVTGFYKDLRDLVSRTSVVAARDGQPVPLNYDNGGTGRVFGLELLVRQELAYNLSGWLSYTLSRAERLDSEGSQYRLFDFDQTHILTAVASYRLPQNWEVGVRWRFVSGNPLTPVTGAVFDVDQDRFDPISGPVNSERGAPFHQLDIRIDKRWVFESWMLNAYLDIQNVYNRRNPEGLQYNYDYTQSQPQQGLPILTVVGLRAEI